MTVNQATFLAVSQTRKTTIFDDEGQKTRKHAASLNLNKM